MTTPASYEKELKEIKERQRKQSVETILRGDPFSPAFIQAFIWITQNESNEISFKFINAKKKSRKLTVLKEKLIRVIQSQPEYVRYSPWQTN